MYIKKLHRQSISRSNNNFINCIQRLQTLPTPLQCRYLVTDNISYKCPSPNDKESKNLILDPHLDPDQYKNVITSRGSFIHSYSFNVQVDITQLQTDREARKEDRIIYICSS